MESSVVSVIMPVHNAAPYLEEALSTVKYQSYRPLEIVVFDDCSTDGSWDLLEKWKDIFMAENIRPVFIKSGEDKAKGPGFGRNNCVLNSRGEYLCHLDADVS